MPPTESDEAPDRRKALRVTGIVFLVYGLLVASHLGEFWPFSIYPMFSEAGRTWTRAVVRDVSDIDDEALEAPIASFDALPGGPVALTELSLNQNDLADFVGRSPSDPHEEMYLALRRMLLPKARDRKLLVVRVTGRLDRPANVRVDYEPFAVVSADTTVYMRAR